MDIINVRITRFERYKMSAVFQWKNHWYYADIIENQALRDLYGTPYEFMVFKSNKRGNITDWSGEFVLRPDAISDKILIECIKEFCVFMSANDVKFVQKAIQQNFNDGRINMDKIVNYVECDQCGSPIIEGDYCDISRDGHVFCGIQCTLDFYGVRCFAFSHTELMSSETQLNWKQCKESEFDEDCMVKRMRRETEKNIWRDE